MFEVETHRPGDALLAQLRAIEELQETQSRVLLSPSQGNDPPDADGVILGDGTEGRWAIVRAKELRSAGFPGLVVVVSPSLVRARALEGYASGVHLWETLPLDPAVLAARMRALSLRIVGDDASLEVSVALERASRSVWVEGKWVKLGPRGFALFEYLLERRGRWVGQQEIVERVFRAKHAAGSPVVRVHVLRVREALGEEHAWIVQGKEGHGYRVILRHDSTAGRLHLPHARFRARRR